MRISSPHLFIYKIRIEFIIALLHRKERMLILKSVLFKTEIGFTNICFFLVPLKVMKHWKCQWRKTNHSDCDQTHNRWLTF